MKVKPARATGGVVMELGRKEEQIPATAGARPEGPPFKIARVLVPVDFSDCAKKALQYAIPGTDASPAAVAGRAADERRLGARLHARHPLQR